MDKDRVVDERWRREMEEKDKIIRIEEISKRRSEYVLINLCSIS
jgi:hypothetical protein